jgi:hypothetical protein
VKEFLVRLTNVIHWTGFLAALSVPPVFFVGYLSGMLGQPSLYSWFELEGLLMLISLVAAAVLLLGAWALKYVLTGRKGFFPWMTK